MLIKSKMLKIKTFLYSDVVIMLVINVKMPTIVGILTFMSMVNLINDFHADLHASRVVVHHFHCHSKKPSAALHGSLYTANCMDPNQTAPCGAV